MSTNEALDRASSRSRASRTHLNRSSAGLAGKHDDGQLHQLRHTYITRLATTGVPARVIMELAGHASLTTTLRYMHAVDGAKEDVIDSLERFDAAPSFGQRGKLGSARSAADQDGR